jgi:hypothetical protein
MGSDDLSLLFQAHLELTQLFGNAHDILYSSTSHREHLYLGGEYVRYIAGSLLPIYQASTMANLCRMTSHPLCGSGN